MTHSKNSIAISKTRIGSNDRNTMFLRLHYCRIFCPIRSRMDLQKVSIMPVIEDKAHINETLGKWFQKNKPGFLDSVSGKEFHQLLTALIEIKDIFKAAELVKRISGATPDEELIHALMDDYRHYTIEMLISKNLMRVKGKNNV